MNHLLAPFIWIDALIQRGVDASAFFLMRRGVPKSRITFNVGLLTLISIVGVALEMFHLKMSVFAVFLLALTALWTPVLIIHKKQNEADEKNGMLLTSHNISDLEGGMKKMWFFILSMNMITYIRHFTFVGVLCLVMASLILLRHYLAKTPNTPPAQKKTVLEPAKESA